MRTDLVLLSTYCLPPGQLCRADCSGSGGLYWACCQVCWLMWTGLIMLFTFVYPHERHVRGQYRGELGGYVVVSSGYIVLTDFKAYTLFTPI